MKEAAAEPRASGSSAEWITKGEMLGHLAVDEASLTEAIATLLAVPPFDEALARRNVGLIKLVRGREVATVEEAYSRSLLQALATHLQRERLSTRAGGRC